MRILARAAALALLVVTVATPFTPVPALLASRLAVAPRLAPADAIVVLGGGLQGGGQLGPASLRRAVAGVLLYHRGLAPVLLLSGGAIDQTAAEGDVMAGLARELGVPAHRILVETVSTNTRSEAVEVARMLHADGKRRILLVTDPFHMIRAQPVFQRVGFEVLPAPADPWIAGRGRPEGNLFLLRHMGQELLGWMYYRARGWV